MKKHNSFLAIFVICLHSISSSNQASSQKENQHTMMPWSITRLMIPILIMSFLFACVSKPPLTPTEVPTQTAAPSPAPTATLAPTQELSAGAARTRDNR